MAGTKKSFYQVTQEIDGVTYTAQFNGLSQAFKMLDNNYIQGSNNLSNEGLTSYILKYVIVDPPDLTIDSFDDIESVNKVAKFGQEVAQGKFREKKNESAK